MFFDQTSHDEGSEKCCETAWILLEGIWPFNYTYYNVCVEKNGISFAPQKPTHGLFSQYRENASTLFYSTPGFLAATHSWELET
jgi:hypothetical protein